MIQRYKLLIIDDSEADAEMIIRHLNNKGVDAQITTVWQPKEIGNALQGETWDVIICDHHLPRFTSHEILKFRQKGPSKHTPLILVSGTLESIDAVELMRNGVADFVPKDDLSRLAPAVLREIENSQVEREKVAAKKAVRRSNLELREALQSLSTAQNKLVAAEKFRALGQMAGGIAHDFNNSLTVLQGTLELMKANHCEDDDLIDRMVTQVEDAATTVRRMRDFYCESADVSETAVEICEILEDVKQFTAPRWKSCENKYIEFEVVSSPGVYVWCDASKLREVLVNLVFNASDAIGENKGGKIVLSADCSPTGVIITISDNGCGMAPETLQRCMEPLFTTKGRKGTGFGLALVDSIVQSFGGRLSIQTQEGEGTSFSFQMKECSPSPRSNQGSGLEKRECSVRSLKIIVVDDEPIIASLVKRLFERLHHEVKAFHSASEVISEMELSKECVPDVIVSDRSMPDVSGDELARIVKTGWPDTRFIMASGFGDLMLATGERPFGVDLVLAKPLSLESLEEGLGLLFSGANEELALPG